MFDKRKGEFCLRRLGFGFFLCLLSKPRVALSGEHPSFQGEILRQFESICV